MKKGDRVITKITNYTGTIDKIAYDTYGLDDIYMVHVKFDGFLIPNSWEFPSMLALID